MITPIDSLKTAASSLDPSTPSKIQMDGWGIIGFEHQQQGLPCQDAWLFSQQEDVSLMCISDGCSGSINSERGSFLLTQATRALFSEGIHFLTLPKEELLAQILSRAKLAALSLAIDLETAHATLMVAVHDAKMNQARIFCWGDGFVGRIHQQQLQLMESASPLNRPYYPAYSLCPQTLAHWESEHGGNDWVSHLGSEDFQILSTQELWIPFMQDDLLFMSSDGAAQMMQQHLMPPTQVFSELLRIKNFTGRYLGRRMTRALREWGESHPTIINPVTSNLTIKDLQAKNTLKCLDDFSLVCMHQPGETQ